MIAIGRRIYDRRPAWASTGVILREEADVLYDLIKQFKPRTIVEVGTAAGVSTAVLATALKETCSDQWELHSIDALEYCYFDKTKTVGQATTEMVGVMPNLFFHRCSTAFDLPAMIGGSPVDFAFIDASHESPWAAVDLLCLLANLREGAIVALHDLLLPFSSGYSHQNAPRDLFRAWQGQKWIFKSAPNLGIVRIADRKQAIGDIATCLQSDWDIDPDHAFLTRLLTLVDRFAAGEHTVLHAFQSRLARCTCEVQNNNEFCHVSETPFVSGSAIHPNDGGDDCTITWKGLSVGDATYLDFTANAFNASALNPGARLSVRMSDQTEWTEFALPPRAYVPVEMALRGLGPVDLEIKALNSRGNSSSYAGIALSRFTLRA